MDTKQTGEMPWDKIWDFRHYRVSRVRAIKYRVTYTALPRPAECDMLAKKEKAWTS